MVNVVLVLAVDDVLDETAFPGAADGVGHAKKLKEISDSMTIVDQKAGHFFNFGQKVSNCETI